MVDKLWIHMGDVLQLVRAKIANFAAVACILWLIISFFNHLYVAMRGV